MREEARGVSRKRLSREERRAAILDAAARVFADRGYDGASIRGIAATAGVDPALVHHYFGTKDELFLAAVRAPMDPDELLPVVLAAEPAERGAAVVRMVLRVWDGPARPAILALVRSAVNHEWSARLLREFVLTKVVRRVVGSFDDMPVEEREARGALVASQVIGMVMARYVLKLEPLASASPESVVSAVGPTIQRYLTGDVELPARRD